MSIWPNRARKLDSLWHCLAPGGWLGIMTKRVRDQEAFRSWHYIDDPTHIAYFSEATFRWLTERWSSMGVAASLVVVGGRCGVDSEKPHYPPRPLGRGPPLAQSRSSTVCTTGTSVPLAICAIQPMLPVGDDLGLQAFDVGDLARLQLPGQARLEDVVGAGRAAADVAFRHVEHLKACLAQ